MAKQFVRLVEDVVFREGTPNAFSYKAGQLGFILNQEQDGRYNIEFTQGNNTFDLPSFEFVTPEDDMSVEEALNLIEEFEGHHTAGHGQFQFNIKMYDGYTFPEKVEKIRELSSNLDTDVWQEHSFLLEQELQCFVGANCDYGLIQVFDWVSEQWHTAGRSGGWLVLNHKYKYSSESLKDKMMELQVDLECHFSNIREYINDASRVHIHEVMDDVNATVEEITELKAELYELAYDLRLIDDKIEHAKASIAEWVRSEEAWEGFLDRVKEDAQESIERSKRLAEDISALLGF